MVHIVDHGTWPLHGRDESRHTPGSELLWSESYYFDFATPDGSLGGYVRLGIYPNWQRAWYWACVVGPDRPLVMLADNLAPLPAPDSTDVRTDAYTATQTIAHPYGPARITLDAAAALVLPDPAAAYGDPSGAETTRLALDLTFDTAGGVYPYRDTTRYEVPCDVSGQVGIGAETLTLTAHGERDHSWAERDWWQLSWLWSAGRLNDGTGFHCTQPNLPFRVGWPSFVVPPGGKLEHRDGIEAETRFAADGTPERSRLLIRGLPMTATPVAFAPLALTSPDGRIGHFPRALCRFAADDGRTGYGWTEWNQPPGWREHDWSAPTGESVKGSRR